MDSELRNTLTSANAREGKVGVTIGASVDKD